MVVFMFVFMKKLTYRTSRDVKYAWEEIRDDLVLQNKKQVDKAMRAQRKKMGK